MAVHTVATVITAKDKASAVFKGLEKAFEQLKDSSVRLSKVFKTAGVEVSPAFLKLEKTFEKLTTGSALLTDALKMLGMSKKKAADAALALGHAFPKLEKGLERIAKRAFAATAALQAMGMGSAKAARLGQTFSWVVAGLAAPLKILAVGLSVAGKVLGFFGNLLKTTVGALLKLGAAVAKLALDAFVAVLGAVVNVLKFAATATLAFGAALTVLAGILTGIIAKATKYAIGLQGVYRAYMSIAQEAAPAMLQALRESSAFMVEEGVLLKEYNRAFLLVGNTLTERLPEALQYLSKAALATGEDVGTMLNALVTGVGRLSTRFRTNIGVTVTLEEATARAMELFGKLADELTYAEKQSGMLDLALKKLEIRTRNMPDVLMSAQQQALAFKTTMKDLWGLVGRIFLPAAQAFYRVLNNTVGAFYKAVQEGGLLYLTLRKLSAAATALFRIFADLGPVVSGAAEEGFDAFVDWVMRTVWEAFEWGANIVNNLAIGMTQAAGAALITAINYISNILTYWLGPGSAPRFLPDIGRWGSAAFTEFLKGFSLAEFKVLEEVQAPLWGALKVLADMGEMSGEAAGMMFIELSYAMTEALDKFRTTGEVSGEIFGMLEAVGGEYGEGLAELFRRELKLATAIKAVTTAEQQLADARRREEESGKKLSKSVREYNRLLREGASPEILRAKLAQAKGAYKNLVVARAEAEQAEKDLELAEKRRKAEQEQVTLQQKLLRQLIKLGQIWADLDGDGDEDGDGPSYELPEPTPPYIEPIDVAFEDLVARIRARFEKLWADLRLDWEASGVLGIMDELKERWEQSELKMWFEEFILDVREEGVRTALSNLWLKLAPTIQAWLTDKDSWWSSIWRAFTQEGIEDGSGKVNFKAALQALWIRAARSIQVWLDSKDTWWGDVWSAFTQDGIVDGSGKVDFAAALSELWLGIKKELNSLAVKVGFWFSTTLWDSLANLKGPKGGNLWISLGWNFAAGLLLGFITKLGEVDWSKKIQIADVLETMRSLLEGSLKWALEWFHGKLEAIEKTANSLREHFEHLVDWIHNLRDAFNDLVLPDWLQSHSPPPLETALLGIGEALVKMPEMPLLLNTEGASGGSTAPTIYITNHFGRDSVRSDRDIRDITEAMQRSLELRGVRERIA